MKKTEIEIKNIWTGSIMFEFESSKDNYPEALGEAVCSAVLRGVDLSGAVLTGADLSGAVLTGTGLSGAVLTGADLSGADLSGAVLTGANLRGANLSGANLSGANLRGVNLTGAGLTGADLSEADLTGAVLSATFFSGAVLSGVVLGGAALSDCPVKIENIHQKVYQAASSDGALDMSGLRTCETTRDRAGWVIHLAGEGGKALEWSFGGENRGTWVAAAMIYMASDPKLERVPDLSGSNEEALADMKRLAELEAADDQR